MSPINAQRKLARLAAQIGQIQERIEKLSAAMDGMSKPRGAKVIDMKGRRRNGARKGRGRPRGESKAIGKVIKFRGVRVKVMEKDLTKFWVRALSNVEVNGRTKKKGSTFPVSTTVVFKQLA